MMPFTHGIIAVSPSGEVVHFAGYVKQPTTADFVALQIELDEDSDFGLVGKRGGYKLIEAPKRIVEEYLGMLPEDL